MEKQVNKDHYNFKAYSHLGRWASYFFQLEQVFSFNPASILEIGVGDRVFGDYIKNNTDIKYISADVAEDLKPDVVASVTALPFTDGEFDVSCAFEVLEHIPFDSFEDALREMARVSKKAVIISLPHFGPSCELSFKIPFIKRVKLAFKLPFHPIHAWNGEHYFEIGKKGYEVGEIRNVLRKDFVIQKDFVPFENQYHHFFVLVPKK
ncbi:MAG: class I SAM-dependent methyltransferase [Candidatus Pacebacteria bacterium]|nr:class I SAM-dependent methyltransferase [Candidatus Paceibacterota bacterium]